MLLDSILHIWKKLRIYIDSNHSHSTSLVQFYLSIGISLFSFVAFLFMISTFGFLAHININKLYVFISLIFSIALIFRICDCKKFIALFIFIAMLALALWFGYSFYDISFDGAWYHQLAIYALKNGWNPAMQSIKDMAFFEPTFESSAFWNDTYLKFGEIVTACIYIITNNIESSKMINVVLLFASLFISLSITLRFLNTLKSWIISIFLAINCFSLVELPTFYVDGILCSCLLIYILSMINLEVNNKNKFINYMLLVLSGLSVISIKLSGMIFIFTLGIAYFVYKILTRQRFQSFKEIFNIAICGIMILAFSIVTNYNPFITNIKNNHHPFYPLAGSQKVEIVQNALPRIFFQTKNQNGKDVIIERNKLDRFIINYFGSNNRGETLSAQDYKSSPPPPPVHLCMS